MKCQRYGSILNIPHTHPRNRHNGIENITRKFMEGGEESILRKYLQNKQYLLLLFLHQHLFHLHKQPKKRQKRKKKLLKFYFWRFPSTTTSVLFLSIYCFSSISHENGEWWMMVYLLLLSSSSIYDDYDNNSNDDDGDGDDARNIADRLISKFKVNVIIHRCVFFCSTNNNI